MSAGVVLAVGLVGGLGAVARFALTGTVSSRVGGAFPWGTLAVNLSGAFLLGVLFGAALDGNAYRIAATGFLGAFTTFSTWMFDSHRLGEDGRLRLGVANLLGSLVLGLAAVWLGRELGALL